MCEFNIDNSSDYNLVPIKMLFQNTTKADINKSIDKKCIPQIDVCKVTLMHTGTES